jgi:hypothetical protein
VVLAALVATCFFLLGDFAEFGLSGTLAQTLRAWLHCYLRAEPLRGYLAKKQFFTQGFLFGCRLQAVGPFSGRHSTTCSSSIVSQLSAAKRCQTCARIIFAPSLLANAISSSPDFKFHPRFEIEVLQPVVLIYPF